MFSLLLPLRLGHGRGRTVISRRNLPGVLTVSLPTFTPTLLPRLFDRDYTGDRVSVIDYFVFLFALLFFTTTITFFTVDTDAFSSFTFAGDTWSSGGVCAIFLGGFENTVEWLGFFVNFGFNKERPTFHWSVAF